MGVLSYIRSRVHHREQAAQLRHQIALLDEQYERLKHGKMFKPGSEEGRKQYWDHFNERDLLEAELDELESGRSIERALYWGVPVPPRPDKQMQINDHWDWSTVHYRHYLNDKGKMVLRRECAIEIEMYYKPWATWIAVIISFVALLVAVLKP